MAWYTAIFLGLVQGLAEFLPISSSGHLLLFQSLFGITDGLLLTVLLHVATLLAVVVVYRRRLWQLIRHPWNTETVRLGLATIITCVIVIMFHDVIDRLFTLAALPYTFIAAGIYLLVPTVLGWCRRGKISSEPVAQNTTKMRPWWQAVAMGMAQGVAVVPGLSRSGLTITTGRLSGMDNTEATDFSFLMSIPIIMASLVYELLHGGSVEALGFGSVILAFVTAFVAGIAAIKIMLNLTRKLDLRWFAFYLLCLGSGLLVGSWF